MANNIKEIIQELEDERQHSIDLQQQYYDIMKVLLFIGENLEVPGITENTVCSHTKLLQISGHCTVTLNRYKDAYNQVDNMRRTVKTVNDKAAQLNNNISKENVQLKSEVKTLKETVNNISRLDVRSLAKKKYVIAGKSDFLGLKLSATTKKPDLITIYDWIYVDCFSKAYLFSNLDHAKQWYDRITKSDETFIAYYNINEICIQKSLS